MSRVYNFSAGPAVKTKEKRKSRRRKVTEPDEPKSPDSCYLSCDHCNYICCDRTSEFKVHVSGEQ